MFSAGVDCGGKERQAGIHDIDLYIDRCTSGSERRHTREPAPTHISVQRHTLCPVTVHVNISLIIIIKVLFSYTNVYVLKAEKVNPDSVGMDWVET